jgi:hypothetical protein
MFSDFIASVRAAVREFRRLRWLRQRRGSIHSPF